MSVVDRRAAGSHVWEREQIKLLDWLDEPRPGHGFHFADDDGGWTLWDYPRLAALAASAAEQIVAIRERPQGVVSIVTHTGPAFIAAFVGALAAGNTPSPLALPVFARDRHRYVEHAAAILEIAKPTLVVADESVLDVMRDASAMAGLTQPICSLSLTESSQGTRANPAEHALLQFTSGSSGHPRGVRVTSTNLESNLTMILRWLEAGPEDQTTSWLPLYHDMGLIGCFLTPTVKQADVWIMRPDQFIADPLRWIECLGARGVNISVAPNFGFAYAAKRLTDEALAGMDFTSWRVAIVGAERLDPAVLGAFARRLAPYGFSARTLLPAYGLAEATLAVTGVPLRKVPRVVRPRWKSARFASPLAIDARASIDDADEIGTGEGWLVGCGEAHSGVSVAIVDEREDVLPDGHLGEIVVAGDTVADGYEGVNEGSTRFVGDHRIATGDAGFILDGELFVAGRLGDAIKIRGRTVFVEDIEARLTTVEEVKHGKCVVLAGSEATIDLIAAVVEAPPGAWVDAVAKILRTEGGASVAIKVCAAPAGAIERTSSGKPRRRVMWRSLLDGRLEVDTVYASVDSTGG
jgi:acyl-CoA synthetase (AMP-forming)/AMP-acid ligase II